MIAPGGFWFFAVWNCQRVYLAAGPLMNYTLGLRILTASGSPCCQARVRERKRGLTRVLASR